MGVPSLATAPNAHLFPSASAGGPTIQSHPMTTFPLLQSVVSITPNAVAADSAAMNGGATLAFDADNGTVDEYLLGVPGLGLSNVSLVAGGWYCYSSGCGQTADRGVEVDVSLTDPSATGNLSWTTYGFWQSYGFNDSATTTIAAFVTGYRTPTASVPTTGTATYSGSVGGRVMFANDDSRHNVGIHWLTGSASMQANFGSGAITGSLTNMSTGAGPWNSVSLLGAISGGNFTGTTAATSAPVNEAALSGSATGTFAGMFFGPGAQELGAVWTLYDGAKSAIGTIGAKTGP